LNAQRRCQKVFVETNNKDHNILSFDAADTRQQMPHGYPAAHNTICSFFFVDIKESLFFFVNVDIVWSGGDPGSFRRCVSKSLLQTWRQSILLSKNHQKVVETNHKDHNIQSFDAVEDQQETSSGCQPDHNTTCFIFLH
jgi:hypothetical protein